MAANNSHVDDIVRRVVNRLEEIARGGNREQGSPGRTARKDRSEVSPDGLVLTDRVVSLVTLEGRLENISKIVVTPAAVVTPSVRDELRARKIAIEVAAPDDPVAVRSTGVNLVVGVVDMKYDPAQLLDSLRGHACQVAQLAGVQLTSVIAEMGGAVADLNQLGLLLTCSPAAAVCHLNRDDTVRAAWGIDGESTAEAVASIDCNVLVIDPGRHSLFELTSMARIFIDGQGKEISHANR